MTENIDKYKDKCIRFYDKKDHYELWFADDFYIPTSGTFGGTAYTLLVDVIEDLHNANKNKELHILIWSIGGYFTTLLAILNEVKEFKRKIGINLSTCHSAGMYLWCACEERYTVPFGSFMYHEPGGVEFGKLREITYSVEHTRQLLNETFKVIPFEKILTPEELKLGETTEVWLTGKDLIDRRAAYDYDIFKKRVAPKPISDEFFEYNDKIYRYTGNIMVEYVPVKHNKTTMPLGFNYSGETLDAEPLIDAVKPKDQS